MSEALYRSCTLCPRKCGVDRTAGMRGACRAGDAPVVARAALHLWEEPCISGTKGSGAVFFSGCSLGCVYCQNHQISSHADGKPMSAERLADVFLDLEQQGAHNINLVTPTHFVPHILRAIERARALGMALPVLYNTGGYERMETLRLLDGYIDIYLPDMKYASRETAAHCSHAPDYPDVVKEALAEMFRQVGPASLCKDGLLRSGLLVRHLVLPGRALEAKRIIRYLHRVYGGDILLSIMNQYTPTPAVKKDPRLCRPLRRSEYDSVLDYAISIGVENAFVQEDGTAQECYIPEFHSEGI